MELVLEVFYGPASKGTTVFFIDKLEGLKRPMQLASSAFLLHSLEVVLLRYFRALRMATTEANILVRDISSPTKCAAHLTTMLKGFISTVDTQEKLNEAMSRYQLHDYRGRIRATAKGVATVTKNKKEKAAVTFPIIWGYLSLAHTLNTTPSSFSLPARFFFNLVACKPPSKSTIITVLSFFSPWPCTPLLSCRLHRECTGSLRRSRYDRR